MQVKPWQLVLLAVLLPLAGVMTSRSIDQSDRILSCQRDIKTADVLFKSGDIKGSILHLEQALAADPYSYQAYRDLSASYFSLTHDRTLCILTYRRALLFLPGDGLAHEDLGRLYYLSNNFKDATTELQTAKSLGIPHEDQLLDRARLSIGVRGELGH